HEREVHPWPTRQHVDPDSTGSQLLPELPQTIETTDRRLKPIDVEVRGQVLHDPLHAADPHAVDDLGDMKGPVTLPYAHRFRINPAGLPPTTEYGSTSWTTTLPAATTLFLPTFAMSTLLLPIQESPPMTIFSSRPPCSRIGMSKSSKLCWCFP